MNIITSMHNDSHVLISIPVTLQVFTSCYIHLHVVCTAEHYYYNIIYIMVCSLESSYASTLF